MSKLNSRSKERRSELLSLVKVVLRTVRQESLITAVLSSEGRHHYSERSSLPRILALTTAGLLLASLPALAKQTSVPAQSAVIENSGSTNTFGYKITVAMTKGTYHISAVSSGGNDTSSDSGKPSGVQPLVSQLFTDLKAAMPLTSLPVRHGMRSASFGTRTTITYKGMTSPDLTFASDPRSSALKADIAAITKSLGVGNLPKRPIVVESPPSR